MKEFEIYFEIYGKKMRAKISALSEERAINILRNKITIHKVKESQESYLKDVLDSFNSIFEIIK